MSTTTTVNATAKPNRRIVRCRMTDRFGGACTAESLGGELAEIHICSRHAALVLEMINRQARIG